MISTMLLSVVIPMFNGEKYISECIHSIVEQELSGNDLEIIVVDDGSTDGGADIVKELMKIYDNIILLQQDNQGLGKSRNNGADVAKGEWIHFVDCDDRISDNSYQLILDQLFVSIQNGFVPDVVSFKSQTLKGGKITHPYTPTNQIQFQGTFFDYVNNYGFRIPVWGYWISRRFWDSMGVRFSSMSYAEDVMFNVELFHKYNNLICVLDIIVYDYIVQSNSITTNQSVSRLSQAIKDMADIYRFVEVIMKTSKYDSLVFAQPFRLLSQPAFARLITGKFSVKERKELILYCTERRLFPLQNLINSKVMKIGNSLIRHPRLMSSASSVYRRIFIPYVKPHLDSNTGHFVFSSRSVKS